MSCLGERLTALVDGELGHDERERALAHLAACARCRAEAATLRGLKGRLRGLGAAPEPGADDLPTDDFVTRLRALGGAAASVEPPPAPPVPPDEPTVTSGRFVRPRRSSVRPSRPVRAAAFAGPRDTRPAGHAAALARPRRRYLVMGAATLVLGLGTASYAAGARQQGPAVTPEFDRFAVEHAMTSGDAPVTGDDPRTLGEVGARSPQSASPGAVAPGRATPSTGPVASPVASVPVHAGP
ncbi:zf-HC2 domain-containing protein [Actinomadura sp. LOL_016]|uniref:zf-HC2 domain-containing protein n=1 Tax=Actinomadura sp. LOL_016 TaxID=3345411 RepID=UPI003A845F05